jgi:hypothetical protein
MYTDKKVMLVKGELKFLSNNLVRIRAVERFDGEQAGGGVWREIKGCGMLHKGKGCRKSLCSAPCASLLLVASKLGSCTMLVGASDRTDNSCFFTLRGSQG